MSEELKPCPFCGGEAEIRREDDDNYRYTTVFVECKDCVARGEHFDYPREYTDDQAIKVWNTRANETNKHEQALLDVLRNKLCEVVDENDHPADQRDNLICELERLLAPDLFDAYEGALDGYINADSYNARAKK